MGFTQSGCCAGNQAVPAVILTGDISTSTLRSIADAGCDRLSKPVKLKEVIQTIQHLLPLSQPLNRAPRHTEPMGASGPPVIFIVDDDDGIRAAMRGVLEEDGREVR